jgi:hypothetical protein
MVALFDNVTPFPAQGKSNEWYTPARPQMSSLWEGHGD